MTPFKALITTGTVLGAGTILVVSVLRTATVKYSFRSAPVATPAPSQINKVPYDLPQQGNVGPGDLLWPIEAIRDQVWLAVNTDLMKKTEITLLLADKRMLSAQQLAQSGKTDDAVMVANKAGMYLEDATKLFEEAQTQKVMTTAFANKFALATLKHREILETLFIEAPEDAGPYIVRIMDFSKTGYEKASQYLRSQGQNPPDNPF